jgi:DNA-directed RNA polymerase subunit RPC12/RpoP
MSGQVVEEYCKNCGTALFERILFDDGHYEMANPNLWPESDGESKYFRCESCNGKNLVAVIQEPGLPTTYEIVGFIRR